jgi:hypothetical protein
MHPPPTISARTAAVDVQRRFPYRNLVCVSAHRSSQSLFTRTTDHSGGGEPHTRPDGAGRCQIPATLVGGGHPAGGNLDMDYTQPLPQYRVGGGGGPTNAGRNTTPNIRTQCSTPHQSSMLHVHGQTARQHTLRQITAFCDAVYTSADDKSHSLAWYCHWL